MSLEVSSHAPVKGATLGIVELLTVFIVSSHAPVKGATDVAALDAVCRVDVSSHAPVKGATAFDAIKAQAKPVFQVMPP